MIMRTIVFIQRFLFILKISKIDSDEIIEASYYYIFHLACNRMEIVPMRVVLFEVEEHFPVDENCYLNGSFYVSKFTLYEC